MTEFYRDQEIVWYSPELDIYHVAKWEDGEIFCDEIGFCKLVFPLSGPDHWVKPFYMINYL